MTEQNMWSEMLTEAPSSGGSGDKLEFIKFPEGVTKVRIASPEKHQRWVHWMNQHKRSANCPGKNCPICALIKSAKDAGETPKYNSTSKQSILAINRTTGQVEIIDQGKTFMEDLVKTMKKAMDGDEFDELPGGWTPDMYDIAVRREGTGRTDTRYSFKVIKQDASDKDNELMSSIEPDTLEKYFKSHTPEQLKRVLAGEDWNEVMKNTSDDDEEDEDINLK